VKDPAIILEALRGLESIDGKPVHVWFMGDGELKETLEELAHRCLPQRVRFLGFRSQDQMADVYADADILVLPSEGETWGLVVNEALMFGVPCVVSDRVGCAPDLIDPGASGLVFPQGNAAALRDAIVRMTRALGSARDAVARQCRQRVSRYSSHAAAEGIAEAVRLARAGASEI
jgi:glycosyltransferase involved in cell wall biosynthesis